MAKVSLVRCERYELQEVEDALKKALAPLGGICAFVQPGQKVLLKVNMLLGTKPDKAVTTHPVVVEAVAKMAIEAGGVVKIGDSAGGADYGLSEKALNICGFEEAAKRAGAETILFETAGRDVIPVKNSRFIPNVNTTRAVTDADVIINLPKLKTHIETLMTGAVKNLLGCLPGAQKLIVHRLAPSPWDLGQALLDIYSAIPVKLTILDGIVAMEGNGPNRGTPVSMGALLASTDGVAMDVVASKLMGYDPAKIPTIVDALERGLGESRENQIEIIGESIKSMRPKKFKRASNAMMRAMPKSFLHLLNKRFYRVNPVWSAEGCEHCGLCVKSCPVEAMQEEGDRVLIDEEKCIECFCCFELCPAEGINVKKSLLAKILSG